MKLQQRHKEQIKSLFKQGFTLEEIHIAFNHLIPYKQLRELVKHEKKQDRLV